MRTDKFRPELLRRQLGQMPAARSVCTNTDLLWKGLQPYFLSFVADTLTLLPAVPRVPRRLSSSMILKSGNPALEKLLG